MFTFPRTAKRAAPEALRSFGSALKSTPRRPLSSFTGARSEDARYAWISRRIARVHRGRDVISADRHQAEAQAERQTKGATAATTSRATAVTMTAAATTEAAAGRSRSPSARKAAGAVSVARSAASKRALQTHTTNKYSGEV